MTLHDTYTVWCICEQKLTSETREFTCPTCGLKIEAEWPCVSEVGND